MSNVPLMPMATAVWLVENTTLTFKQIAEFCKSNYGVTFPMMSKISVKGDNKHPLYDFLTKKSLNGVIDSSVRWNFQKYLINAEGIVEKVISPWVSPDDSSIVEWIKS